MAHRAGIGDFDYRPGRRPMEPHQSPSQRTSYKNIKWLAEGGQGEVWEVQSRNSGKVYAMKSMKKYEMLDGLPKEIHILKKVVGRHRNLIELKDYVYRPDEPLLMYFDLYTGGDLYGWCKHVEFIPESTMWALFIQRTSSPNHQPSFGCYQEPRDMFQRCTTRGVCLITLEHIEIEMLTAKQILVANAIVYLHYGYDRKAKDPHKPHRGWQSIVHADIKTENVFIRTKCDPETPLICPQIVIGDFGSATLNPAATGEMTTTPVYQPPEIGRVMTAKSDVWSVGAIVHELGHGDPPVVDPPEDWNGTKDEWLWWPRARRVIELKEPYTRTLNSAMMVALQYDIEDRATSRALIQRLMRDRPP